MLKHTEFAAGRLTGVNGKETRERQGQKLAKMISTLGPAKSWKQIQGVSIMTNLYSLCINFHCKPYICAMRQN